MPPAICAACGSTDNFEVDNAAGNAYCLDCGAITEENTIVSEITFGENSTGAAVVTGAYLGNDQLRVRSGNRRGGNNESREQTLSNGRRVITQLAVGVKLAERYVDSAHRWFVLAVGQNFNRGRRTQYVCAACLYIACRMENTSVMLIDLSDIIEINVFVLGQTYLKLVKELNLTMQPIDPSLYISRFASLLEFGEETQRVAQDAVRLVKRFDRDWMQIGRRPSGICGACLFLAARMNNFRRSVREIVQVVKIADVTVQKRLDEFSKTKSSALTVSDFRSVWLEDSANPPIWNLNKRKEAEEAGMDWDSETETAVPRKRKFEDLNEEDADAPITKEEQEYDQDVYDDIEHNLGDEAIQDVAHTLDERDRAHANAEHEYDDALDNLDEEELDMFILTEDEVKIKERLWIDANHDYLQEIAAKHLRAENDEKPVRKPRKKKAAPRDSTNAQGETAADATKQMLQKKKFSKKINYNVIDSLFKHESPEPTKGNKKAKIQEAVPEDDEEGDEEDHEAEPEPDEADNNMRLRYDQGGSDDEGGFGNDDYDD